MKPLKSSYPVGHLLNPKTEYVCAAETDLKKTFARIRAREKASERKSTDRRLAAGTR
jgi:hypothetical protein